jgi:hypothetical protein
MDGPYEADHDSDPDGNTWRTLAQGSLSFATRFRTPSWCSTMAKTLHRLHRLHPTTLSLTKL